MTGEHPTTKSCSVDQMIACTLSLSLHFWKDILEHSSAPDVESKCATGETIPNISAVTECREAKLLSLKSCKNGRGFISSKGKQYAHGRGLMFTQ